MESAAASRVVTFWNTRKLIKKYIIVTLSGLSCQVLVMIINARRLDGRFFFRGEEEQHSFLG